MAAFLVSSAICHRMAPSAIDNWLLGGRIVGATAVMGVAIGGEAISPFAPIGFIALALVALGIVEPLLGPDVDVEMVEVRI